MPKSRSLLERYEIPLAHLDFDYVKNCNNTKELEKIVTILRSGEEGYYPDLTKCAEDRLILLKPHSKILRTEETVPTKARLTPSDWKEINEPVVEWINDVREKDQFLSNLPENGQDIGLQSPPIRDFSQINQTKVKEETVVSTNKGNRIKSTEYNKWDKYDADTEELKIDLDEERAREEVERMNRLNLKKSAQRIKPSLENIDFDQLSEIEKEALALKFKERGNDYFRAKEYNEAVWEYTQCIQIAPNANAFNNRAVSHLKLNNYKKCIDDCDSCLAIDENNIKAFLRKAQAFLGLDSRREAYEIYARIIVIDPDNTTAKKYIKDLQQQLPNLPPVSATRIRIIEEDNSCTENTAVSQKTLEASDKKQPETNPIVIPSKSKYDDDLSKLILPNKIVKSKLKTVVETMGTIQKQRRSEIQKVAKEKINKPIPEIQIISKPNDSALRKGILIEEIGN